MEKAKEKEEKKEEKKEAKKSTKTSTVKTSEPNVSKMSIFEKMAAVTNEIGVVNKNLNVQGKYKAVAERDVLDAVKALEEKYRIWSYPFDRKIETITSLASKYVALRCEVVYRFLNLDNSSEYVDIKSYGDGVDTLDKAPGKAMTYADKYALMKAYKLSTGDDPDQEPSPDVAPVANKITTLGAVTNNTVSHTDMITPEQVAKIKTLVTPEREQRMLSVYKKEKIEELSEITARAIIRKLEKEAEDKKAKEAAAAIKPVETNLVEGLEVDENPFENKE